MKLHHTPLSGLFEIGQPAVGDARGRFTRLFCEQAFAPICPHLHFTQLNWSPTKGRGSLRGTLIAALVIGLSDGVISMFFTPTLAKILATLLVAMVLVFRPQGLFGARA